MTKPKTYKSEALATVHEMIEGLRETRAIDKWKLRELDEACPAVATQVEDNQTDVTRNSKSAVGA